MVGANTLDAVQFHLDLLTGAQLGKQDIRVNGLNGTLVHEVLLLTANRVEGDILRIHMGIVVQLARVLLALIGVAVLGALCIEAQNDSVEITRLGRGHAFVLLGRLAEPVHPVDSFHRALERDQTQTLCEYLILDDGSVVVNEDELDGKRRNLGHKDTAEGIGDGSIEADQRERGLVRIIAVVFDFEVL